ncbi:MAG TPA: DUF3107 family protein [Acidimicrobiia bacterium]|nr:DUF3107 family protein [Acidimicrobiia bacterium]
MAENTNVRIGFQGARELELEVADAADTRATIEDGVAAEDRMVWVEDSRGHMFGLVVEKVAFVEIEGESGKTGIGFGS